MEDCFGNQWPTTRATKKAKPIPNASVINITNKVRILSPKVRQLSRTQQIREVQGIESVSVVTRQQRNRSPFRHPVLLACRNAVFALQPTLDDRALPKFSWRGR